ncbi:MAG: sigma-54 dependent transcriptional regulator [Microscillaceae bacterium]|nr:sigma-54 dependent transcriptional regulator [Microscillaceae bacterium]
MIREADIQSVKQRFGIIGNSSLLNNALRRAIQVAETEMSVLITGESGSGKESFSKIIHQLSARKHGQFIAINCGAIPAGTIYSELFGHEKGAYTGASTTEARKGYFETADGGTIFLDEIGEMPAETQVMLLRVLENGEFIRMGSSKAQKTNVRVVAATNVDLIKAVESKKFREDLYYRLSTVPIFVPPLRERGQDVVLLFRKFAVDFAERYRVQPIALNDEAKEILQKFRFPGNIRQLKNITEQISLLEVDNRDISAETLLSYLPPEQNTNALTLVGGGSHGEAFSNFSEREILFKVMFDLKKDVTELKKLMFELIQNGTLSSEVIKNHQDLFQNIEETEFVKPAPVSTEALVLASNYKTDKNIIEINSLNINEAQIHDIQHEEEADILSIEQKEKELILKALQKNRNKRKYAAQDLGISERTLYRKIKQYDLDNFK